MESQSNNLNNHGYDSNSETNEMLDCDLEDDHYFRETKPKYQKYCWYEWILRIFGCCNIFSTN